MLRASLSSGFLSFVFFYFSLQVNEEEGSGTGFAKAKHMRKGFSLRKVIASLCREIKDSLPAPASSAVSEKDVDDLQEEQDAHHPQRKDEKKDVQLTEEGMTPEEAEAIVSGWRTETTRQRARKPGAIGPMLPPSEGALLLRRGEEKEEEEKEVMRSISDKDTSCLYICVCLCLSGDSARPFFERFFHSSSLTFEGGLYSGTLAVAGVGQYVCISSVHSSFKSLLSGILSLRHNDLGFMNADWGKRK